MKQDLQNNTTRFPTVGRIVHYYPAKSNVLFPRINKQQPFAAAIVVGATKENTTCSLTIFMDGGSTDYQVSVLHKTQANEDESYWKWHDEE